MRPLGRSMPVCTPGSSHPERAMVGYDELIGAEDGDFESASVSGEATAVILYTSGTTDFPGAPNSAMPTSS